MALLDTYRHDGPVRIVFYRRHHSSKVVDACNNVGLSSCGDRAILCTSPAVESRPKRIATLDDDSGASAP